MRVVHYLATGTYMPSKRELLAALDGNEKAILAIRMDPGKRLAPDSQKQECTMLHDWCGQVLTSDLGAAL